MLNFDEVQWRIQGGPGCSNTPLSVNSLIIHTVLLLALSSLDPRKHAGYYRNRALERPAIASLRTYSSKLIDGRALRIIMKLYRL